MSKSRTRDVTRNDSYLLDPVERAIIRELEENPLVSNREIGDRLDLTVAQVVTRIRRIAEKNIARVVAVINSNVIEQLGGYFRISVSGRNIHDVANDIAQVKSITWLSGLSGGDAELAGALRYRDATDLLATISTIGKVAGITNLHLDLQLAQLTFRNHYLGFVPQGSDDDEDESITKAAVALETDLLDVVPDPLDRNIIAELCRDGRISSRQLGRKYGVNAGTIRYRIRALESRGVIGLHALVDPSAVGLRCFALLRVCVDTPHFDAVATEMKKKDWLPFLLHTSGEMNLTAVALTADWDEVRNRCSTELATLEGVRHYTLGHLFRNYKVDPRFS